MTGLNMEPWLVLELYENCQIDKQLDAIVNELTIAFGDDVEYFIPLHVESVANKNLITCLFDGYVFVKAATCADIHAGVSAIRGGCFNGPLIHGGEYHYLPGLEIDRYKEALQDKLFSWMPRAGEEVIAKVGVFRNMVGVVASVNKKEKTAQVVFKTRSREVTADMKILNLVSKKMAGGVQGESFLD